MSSQSPSSLTAVPTYKEEAAGTACVSDGWLETSASFAGVLVVEDRRLWVPVQEFLSVPLGRQVLAELEPASIAQPGEDEVGKALASVASADAAGNLRRAFRLAFRALDQQMLGAHWEAIQKLLLALLSKPYSTDLGVGVLRFCSAARQHIANWAELIDVARSRCAIDGVDHKVVLRGLV